MFNWAIHNLHRTYLSEFSFESWKLQNFGEEIELLFMRNILD